MSDARQRLRDWKTEIAIILGSGLDAIVQDPIESIEYVELSELPEPRVPGHAGKFSLCQISGVRVIFAQGRVHLYEGYSAGERSEEHTSELQSHSDLVCRLLLEKK